MKYALLGLRESSKARVGLASSEIPVPRFRSRRPIKTSSSGYGNGVGLATSQVPINVWNGNPPGVGSFLLEKMRDRSWRKYFPSSCSVGRKLLVGSSVYGNKPLRNEEQNPLASTGTHSQVTILSSRKAVGGAERALLGVNVSIERGAA